MSRPFEHSMSSKKSARRQQQEEKLLRFKITCSNLVAAAAKLNSARDEFRASVEQLAGIDLSEWSVKDLMRYADLAYEQHPASPYQKATELLQQFVDAIKQAEKESGK